MRTALVVDDDPFHRELLEVFLGTMGFNPVWAVGTPQDAMEVYRKAAPKPSVVLVDHQMGMSDGLRLVEDMVREDGNVRAILLSRDPEVERDSYKAGAIEFIQKPYSIHEIGRAVNRAMRPGVVS